MKLCSWCFIDDSGRSQVQDTGLGLNSQDIPMLFNKFVQADSTTTRNYGGTGLGLAICKRYDVRIVWSEAPIPFQL